MEEPRLEGGSWAQESRSSIKFARNAKGDTQIEVKAVDGTTPEEMEAIRLVAFDNYKKATEAVGYILPTHSAA